MVAQSLKCTETESEVFTRRVSARIKEKQRADKELLFRRRVLSDQKDSGGGGRGKSVKHCCKRARADKTANGENENVELEKTHKGFEVAAEPMNRSLEATEAVAACTFEKSDHAKVKETLRLFNKYYLHFVQVSVVTFCSSFRFTLSGSLSIFFFFFFWGAGRGKEVWESGSRKESFQSFKI